LELAASLLVALILYFRQSLALAVVVLVWLLVLEALVVLVEAVATTRRLVVLELRVKVLLEETLGRLVRLSELVAVAALGLSVAIRLVEELLVRVVLELYQRLQARL
jgi:hypothetical protein